MRTHIHTHTHTVHITHTEVIKCMHVFRHIQRQKKNDTGKEKKQEKYRLNQVCRFGRTNNTKDSSQAADISQNIKKSLNLV